VAHANGTGQVKGLNLKKKGDEKEAKVSKGRCTEGWLRKRANKNMAFLHFPDGNQRRAFRVSALGAREQGI